MGIKKKKLKGKNKRAAEALMEEQWGFYNHHGLRSDSQVDQVMRIELLDDSNPEFIKLPISTKLSLTRASKELFQQDYQNQLLLYNILLLNTFYHIIPQFMSQKKKKYQLLISQVSKRKHNNNTELLNYWMFLENFYKYE